MENWPYLLLLLCSAICFSGQFASMKLYKKSVKDGLINSFLFSLITGFIIFLCFGIISLILKTTWNPYSLLYAFIFGLLSFSTQIIGLFAMKFGNMSVFSLFAMLGGMVLPFAFGLIYYHEKASICMLIGFSLMIVSLFFPIFDQHIKKDENKSKNGFIFLILCFLEFILNGSVSIVSSLHSHLENAVSTFCFTSLSSGFIFVFSLIGLLIVIFLKKDKTQKRDKIGIKSLFFASSWAICNGGGNILSLEAVKHLDTSLNYPVLSGGVIVFTFLIGRFIFKEKNGIFTYIGTLLTLAATILFLF